jgi:hypothetical protein
VGVRCWRCLSSNFTKEAITRDLDAENGISGASRFADLIELDEYWLLTS